MEKLKQIIESTLVNDMEIVKNIISDWLKEHGTEDIRIKTENRLNNMKDLNTFKERFLSDRYKELPNRLEYHGQDLDNALPTAKYIINKYGLNLTARTTGDMAQQRRFEVIIND